MHTLDERLLRLFCAEEVIEDSTFNAECLLPARRAVPHRIFKVGPQGKENVVGIKDVSGQRALAAAAEIGAGYRLVFIHGAVSAQELQAHAGVQQSRERVRLKMQLSG